MHMKFSGYIPVLALCLLASCSLVPPKPQNVSEAVAISYATITALGNQTATEVIGGVLTKEQGREVLSVLNQAKQLTDFARSAPTDSEALRNLELATAILTSVQNYLIAKQ